MPLKSCCFREGDILKFLFQLTEAVQSICHQRRVDQMLNRRIALSIEYILDYAVGNLIFLNLKIVVIL